MGAVLNRESIRRAAIGERKYIRHFDGRGHFAHLVLRVSPAPGPACSITRDHSLTIPEGCFAAARDALAASLRQGPLCRLPMWGVSIVCVAGTYLERFSYPEAFAVAARMALDDAFARAKPIVMEPWTGALLRVDRRALGSVLDTLSSLLGTFQVEVVRQDFFTLRLQFPLRLAPAVQSAFQLRRLERIPLPPEQAYRPVEGK